MSLVSNKDKEVEKGKYLYKYIAIPNLADINKKKIESIKLDMAWFSKVRELNDPFELLAEYGKTRKDIQYKNLLDKIEILSLTQKDNDLLMWSHYAVHKGCCLMYEVENEHFLHMVKYLDKRPVPSGQLQDIFLVKSIDWKYESEIRVINIDDTPNITLKENKGRNILCTDIGIKLKKIIIGVDTPETVRNELISIAREKNIDICSAVMSATKFSLDYQQVKACY